MINLVECPEWAWGCDYVNSLLRDSPVVLWLITIVFLVGSGLWILVTRIIPKFQEAWGGILETKTIFKFKQLQWSARRAKIEGRANQNIMEMAQYLPSGWVSPLKLKFVRDEDKRRLLDNEGETIIVLRISDKQEVNLVRATYEFFKKSLFPRTNRIIPKPHRDACFVFLSKEAIEGEDKDVLSAFQDYVLEPVLSQRGNKNLLKYMDQYKKMYGRGYFTGAFLREVHTVAEVNRENPLRTKFASETDGVISHILEFMDAYEKSQSTLQTMVGRKGEKRDKIPSETWHKIGELGSYAFILVASTLKRKAGVKADGYVKRARQCVSDMIERVYIFGAAEEKEFVQKVIRTIDSSIPELQLVEEFVTPKDYRGQSGGLGALFALKNSTK